MNEQPDFDDVARDLPGVDPEQAAEGMRKLMQEPSFRKLVEHVQSGEYSDDELRDEAMSFAHDLAARQELRRDE